MGTKLQHVHFPMHDHYQVQHENKILHKTQFSLLGELVRIEKMRAPQAKKVDVLMKKIKYLGHEYNKNLVICHYICPIQCLQKINGEFFGVIKKFLLCKKKIIAWEAGTNNIECKLASNNSNEKIWYNTNQN